ncbi:IclR family transcriptional regulator [Halegenticoccus soli]|uniref:IclR family transcriptional regulator n=1 Tax=Halegenticoccus soli TaxID=1985678 RepID=UPI000C6EBE83|nr:IclR family transcriptional regulator [Halegenticoccus soli]
MEKSESPRTVEAVETALGIIEYLQREEQAGVTELANELGRSKGTIHSHLATLVQSDYLTKKGSKYRLSLRYLELGETVKDRLGYYGVIADELDDLAKESGELAQFATEEHGMAVYLYKARGEKAVESASTIGKREYPHCISLGKAILAHLPRKRVGAIIDRNGLKAYTPQTITTREALFDELETIRERGYAIDNEEKIKGLKCIAAPVTSPNGDVLGAVSVSGPSSRMQGKRFEEELPQMVTRSANVIEINIQFS